MAARKKKTKNKSNVEPVKSNLPVFVGLFLVALGIFMGLSFATADVTLDPEQAARRCATGLFGAWAAYGIVITLGHHAAYFLAGLICLWGTHVMRRRELFATWPQVFGGVVMVAAFAMIVDAFGAGDLPSGGLVGFVLGPPARMYLGRAGVLIAASGLLSLGAILAFGNAAFDAAEAAWALICRIAAASGLAVGRTAILAGRIMQPRVAKMLAGPAERVLMLAEPDEDTSSAGGAKARKSKTKKDTSADPETEDSVSDDAREVEAAVVPDFEPGFDPLTTAAPEFTPYGLDDPEAAAEFATTTDKPLAESPPVAEPERTPPPVIIREEKKKRPRPEKMDRVEVSRRDAADYQLPPLNLLQVPVEAKGEAEACVQKRAQTLEKTLSEFKIDGRVVQIECGPRVTLFEISLAPGIKCSRVVNLADNIAMALKAANVRIIAPIPGKDTIGIEIPNVEQELVTLREVLESINREKRKQALPLCLGKDVSGAGVVADLAKMPHLLIAGATGSGKSVCINSVLLSFLMCCKPEDVKLILIDPKVVELSRFKEIPHLMSPVITDMKRAVSVLEWACQKMDERYEQLSMVSVNNITKFNALGEEMICERLGDSYAEDELALFPKHLPYIIIVIDELADLMMVAGKDVEHHITRLAAKSRAVGIHLILATQRPSVDVITGLIKANMPSRIAFQVSSKVDSRTILDQNGAETLLGAGDMLYLPPGVSKVCRCQGVFVNDEELFAVTDFARQQLPPEYHADLEGPVIGGGGNKTDIEDFDELFQQAGQAIIQSGRGSVSLLQRKLGIGYGRASRIIDQLASVGVLGPFREGKAREIMLTLEEFAAKFGGAQMAMDFDDGDGNMAGQRDDERAPQGDMPWDDEEQ